MELHLSEPKPLRAIIIDLYDDLCVYLTEFAAMMFQIVEVKLSAIGFAILFAFYALFYDLKESGLSIVLAKFLLLVFFYVLTVPVYVHYRVYTDRKRHLFSKDDSEEAEEPFFLKENAVHSGTWVPISFDAFCADTEGVRIIRVRVKTDETTEPLYLSVDAEKIESFCGAAGRVVRALPYENKDNFHFHQRSTMHATGTQYPGLGSIFTQTSCYMQWQDILGTHIKRRLVFWPELKNRHSWESFRYRPLPRCTLDPSDVWVMMENVVTGKKIVWEDATNTFRLGNETERPALFRFERLR